MNNKNLHYMLDNDKNFAKLYEATLAACNLTEFPEGMFTREGNAWVELEEAWDKFLPERSFAIFCEAIHQIMWGIPSCSGTAAYKDIVSVVVEELLNDGDAYDVWSDDQSACYEAVKYMRDTMDPYIEGDNYRFSIEHFHYLSDKMLWKIRYSKNGWGRNVPSFERRLIEYEDAIKKIIPAAKKWGEDYWYDESHIHDEISKLYGIDYRNDTSCDYIDYSRLMIILMNSEEDESERKVKEAWCACNIREMPFSLAKVLWPKNTEEKIVEMMAMAVEEADQADMFAGLKEGYKNEYIHPIGVFEFEALRNSWIYKLMTRWIYNDDHELDSKLMTRVKRMYFYITLKQ